MILVIDNYDSFVHNLARYFRQLGLETKVVRNDRIDVPEIRELAPEAIVISPGPCTPDDAGCCLDIVRQLSGEFPILGVCLGHQAIVQGLGGTITRSDQPTHGRASVVLHDQSGLFDGIPTPMTAGRYHSLITAESTIPDCLMVIARTPDDVVMAIRHETHPVVGVQFHPESVLTEHGYALLVNFLKIAGIDPSARGPSNSNHPQIFLN